ncbi:MAG TPA: hypothetical protein VKZ67_05595 [Natronosporangium sp.]|nr:hypothetical protein [Natronosporangium sp.]
MAEHEEYAGQTLRTRDHDRIRAWAEQRGAKPATVAGTDFDNELGVLRLDFPGYHGSTLTEVSWEDWLRTFDERDLEFIYQEHTEDGRQSNFFKVIQSGG